MRIGKWRLISGVLGILVGCGSIASIFVDPLAQKEEEAEFYEDFKRKFKADLETDILKGEK